MYGRRTLVGMATILAVTALMAMPTSPLPSHSGTALGRSPTQVAGPTTPHTLASRVAPGPNALAKLSPSVASRLGLLRSPASAPSGSGAPVGNGAAVPVAPSSPQLTVPTRWAGLDYNSNLCTCVPPDGGVAAGDGDVVQTVNSALEVWTTSGTLVTTESLPQFFRIPASDFFSDPYIIYDSQAGRWVVSGIDINGATYQGTIDVNVSQTSSFLGGWTEYQFTSNASAVTLTDQPFIALTSENLLVSANIFDMSTGSLLGAEIWMANLTAVLAGAPSPSEYSWGPNASFGSLHPASPIGPSPNAYFVSDNFGAAYGVTSQTFLNVMEFRGSPPAAVTMTDTNLSITPEASAPLVNGAWCAWDATGACLSLDDGRVLSAVWANGYLWGTANEGCLQGGVNDACIRVFEVNTSAATPTLLQQIDFSQGGSSMDSYGAVALDYVGDLGMVFSGAGNATFPSLYVTGATAAQIAAATKAGTPLTLSTPVTVAAGVGLLDPTVFANRWGDYFEISPDANVWNSLWLEGEYIGPNNATDYYSTEVAQTSFPTALYTVNVTASGLAPGTNWTASLNGISAASGTSWLRFEVPNGTYTFAPGAIPSAPGVRYGANITSKPITVAGNTVSLQVHYQKEDLVTTSVWPSPTAGSVVPGSGWIYDGNATTFTATPSPGGDFLLWMGTGTGNYTGTSPSFHVTLSAPITEVAYFGVRPSYAVTVTQGGLPTGTSWSISVNGVTKTTTNASVTFQEPNGTYGYSAPSPIAGKGYGTEFVSTDAVGTVNVSGSAKAVTLSYSAQYEVKLTVSPSNAGGVTPASGWYPAGSLTVNAYGAAGYQFVKWNATGIPGGLGNSSSATFSLSGPVNLTAVFVAASPHGSTSGSNSSGGLSLPLAIGLIAVAAVVALVLGLLVGRRMGRKGTSSAPAGPYPSAPASYPGYPPPPP